MIIIFIRTNTIGWWCRWFVFAVLLFAVVLPPPHVQASKDKVTTGTFSPLPTVMPPLDITKTTAPTPKLKGTPAETVTRPPTAVPPTKEPVVKPDEKPTEVAVTLPEMMFVMGKQNEEDIPNSNMHEIFELFVAEKLLSTGTYHKAFLYTNMTSNSVQDASRIMVQIIGDAVYNPRHAEKRSRRQLVFLREEKETATIATTETTTETAKNYAPVPTENELLNVIQAYFSFWGRQNLQTYLINMKIPITDVRQILLNGVEVEETNKKDTSSVKSPVDQDESTSSSSSGMNYKMVAGIVAGGVVLMAAILSALFIRHRRRKRNAEDTQNYKHVSSGSLADDDIYSVNNNFNTDIIKDMDPSTTVPATPSPDKTFAIDSDSDGGNSPVYPILPSISQQSPPESPVPPPPPQPVFRTFEEYENHDDVDDDDVASEACASDADIVSVTESLSYFENNKGPLFKAGSGGSENKPNEKDNVSTFDSLGNEPSSSTTPPTSAAKLIAMTGKASVRTLSAADFKYDASRLDAVISNAQGLRQQQEEERGK
jgi:hypothetical protein